MKSALQLLVGLLLDGLRILKLLDKLHLELLHLHDLFFLLLAQVVLVANFILVLLLNLLHASLSFLLDFHRCQALLLIHNLILHAILLLDLEVSELLFLFILVLDYLSLLRLFALRLENGLLNLALLICSLLVN